MFNIGDYVRCSCSPECSLSGKILEIKGNTLLINFGSVGEDYMNADGVVLITSTKIINAKFNRGGNI